jgi:hypothetical protein
VKLDEEKTKKHAALDQESGFASAKLLTFRWLVKGATMLLHTSREKECNKYDLMSVFSVSDWPLIMIGPSGLLLVVSHLFPVEVLFSWVLLWFWNTLELPPSDGLPS